MDTPLVLSVAGFIGAMFILVSYTQTTRGKWAADSVPFQAVNAVGSAILLVYSVLIQAYPNVLLNILWLAVAAYTLFKMRKS